MKLEGKQREARAAARARIIDEANAQARELTGEPGDRYSARTLQQAVRTCRANRLVPKRVLEAAGFRS
jgi:hypothetical protein